MFVCHIFSETGFLILSILSNDARSTTMKQICTFFVIFVMSILDSTIASSGEVMGCGGFVKSNKNNIDLSRIQISLYEKRNNIQRYRIDTRNMFYKKHSKNLASPDFDFLYSCFLILMTHFG